MHEVCRIFTGEHRACLKGHTDWVCSVVFSPDGKTLASGSHDRTIKLWDTAGGQERLTPVLLTASLTAFALLPVAIQLRQPGHEIEGPMAVVILGGLVSSTLVTLVLIPPLAARWLRPG